ncbi:zf-HC2 domain-containing protein [Amycolatopsis sp., V23-08]|uniref:Zf-HC2 domain-containing protein n=1 Tax=Amycolatopsis heterodermiae TaxID=3110235 RepID=A0ABU5RBH2_9PSEU|nr:zf-HC2 domain-containing protein [Amycolatopsis sp., V23-08]MEA5363600.1 zf-HC2 domain-containing protein [Amycolatopsis sp., V23-08]
MRCEECREGLSARLDGETEPGPPGAIDRHLDGCAACREWFTGAQRLRRAMLLRQAPAVPDLTASILERTPAPAGEGWGLRIALAVVAIAQLGPAFAQLLGMTHDAMPGHLSHESGAWNLSVGIGLLTAALRPRLAGGQLPLLTGFVGVLFALSAGDLATGRVTVARVATHVLVVLGLALLYAVHRGHRDRTAPLPAATADDSATTSASTVDAPAAARPRSRPFRRQAHGRHAA